jgi:sulfoquinovosidase
MNPEIAFQPRENGFAILYKGLLVAEQRPGHSFLSLGRGRGRYESSHGSFKISEEALELKSSAESSLLESSPERLVILFPGLCKAVFSTRAGRLSLRFEDLPPGCNRLILRLAARPGERVYGCGEQYSYLDLKGRLMPLWTEEQGVGRGPNLIKFAADLSMGAGGTRYSTYYPLPVFLSSEGYSCSASTTAYASFDFRAPAEHVLTFWEVPSELLLDVEPSLPALVSRLSELGGRQPETPAWALSGLILGAQGGAEAALEKLSKVRAAGAAVTGLWTQDWCGRRVTSFGKQLMWNWEADPSLYPDLPAFSSRLAGEGIRLLGYINPFLALEGRLYREASARGFCVRRRDGGEYLATVTSFPAAMVDLTNPEAFAWIKGVIREKLIGAGLAGWMADFGEYLPVDSVLFSGESGERAHNAYPALWARANYEAVAEAGKLGEVFFFCRSGHQGSSRSVPSFWAGDQLVNWNRDDGLPSVLPAALSLGLSGVGSWHSDLGGYTTVGYLHRSSELLVRWAELAAFTPVMRSHEGNRPEANRQIWDSGEGLEKVARLSRLHAALAPYSRAVVRECRETGLPAMRPLFLHYPEDAACRELYDEYLYGRDLLVAPVMKRGAHARKVYLPDDEWVELSSGTEMCKGKARASSPLGSPPVYYRRSSAWNDLFESIRGGL